MRKNKYKYLKADEYVLLNDKEPTLKPIKLSLPKPPELKYIDGYGLNPEDQYFKRVYIPIRLKHLQNTVIRDANKSFSDNPDNRVTWQKIISEIWNRLEEEQEDYVDEIYWLKKQIWFINYGYWFFNNGKPTYITGAHYLYLNYWSLGDTYPEYRERSRRKFMAREYAMKTQEDENGIDIGMRTIFGLIIPKMRREGGTSESLAFGYWFVMYTKNANMDIQSDTGKKSKDLYFDNMITPWQSLPFFLRPTWSGNNRPNELQFQLPQNQSVGNFLNNSIFYVDTAQGSKLDGLKLKYDLSDEEGKTIEAEVDKRWAIKKECLQIGKSIIGYSEHPSTVEDMETMGGQFYKNLCDASDFWKRINGIGQTQSGLMLIFDPSDYCLEGFVGKYGEAIIDNPTEKQKIELKEKYGKSAPTMGSKEFINRRREYLLKHDITEYRRFVKKYPLTLSECFYSAGSDLGFPVEDINKRIAELELDEKMGNPHTKPANFYWVINGVPCSSHDIISRGINIKDIKGDVQIVFEKNGRWDISYKPPMEYTNKRYLKGDVWCPVYTSMFEMGADPYHFSTKNEARLRTDKSYLSDGGGAIKRKRDFNIDPQGKNIKEWESVGMCATYLHRIPDVDEYVLDLLMAAIYYGSLVFPETNVKKVVEDFIRWGYGGYLDHAIDPVTGLVNPDPGMSTQTVSKQNLFMEFQKYLSHHVMHENDKKLLYQCRDIRSMEELTKYDLLTAAMYANYGSLNSYGEHFVEQNKMIDATDIFKGFGLL